MSIEERNNSEEVEKATAVAESRITFADKLITFFNNNKAATILTIVLLVVFIWFTIKIGTNEKNFNNEKKQLITQHESTIDSLNIKHLKFATEVFSWSVRSELLRNNTENLNQLLTVFVKESGADLIQLINPENKMVLLSSNKKFEGSPFQGNLDSEINESVVLKEKGNIKIVTPVMGFNKMIGILVVQIDREK